MDADTMIKRTLSFIVAIALGVVLFTPAQATVAISTPYVSTGCTDISALLSQGRSGIQVTALQNFLYSHNYMKVRATGYFGPITRAAVIRFQSENGLRADGIVGTQTRAHIFAKDCAGLTLPEATPTITALIPQSATVGSTVTIQGTHFTSHSIVHFGIGAVKATVGNNGTTLTFTIPEYIGQYCKPGMACIALAQVINDGTYNVYVENAGEKISNTVQLTVTGAPLLLPQ